jgi:hypothetical protein
MRPRRTCLGRWANGGGDGRHWQCPGGEHGLHADARGTAKESSRPRTDWLKPTAMHPVTKGRREKTRGLRMERSACWNRVSSGSEIPPAARRHFDAQTIGTQPPTNRPTVRGSTGTMTALIYQEMIAPHDTPLTADRHVFHTPAWPPMVVPIGVLSGDNPVCEGLAGRRWAVCPCGCCPAPPPPSDYFLSVHSELKKKEQEQWCSQ